MEFHSADRGAASVSGWGERARGGVRLGGRTGTKPRSGWRPVAKPVRCVVAGVSRPGGVVHDDHLAQEALAARPGQLIRKALPVGGWRQMVAFAVPEVHRAGHLPEIDVPRANPGDVVQAPPHGGFDVSEAGTAGGSRQLATRAAALDDGDFLRCPANQPVCCSPSPTRRGSAGELARAVAAMTSVRNLSTRASSWAW